MAVTYTYDKRQIMWIKTSSSIQMNTDYETIYKVTQGNLN